MGKLPHYFKIAVFSSAEAMKVLEAFDTYKFRWRNGVSATQWYPNMSTVAGFHVDDGIISFSDNREYFNNCSEPQLQLCDLIQRNTSVAVNSDMLSMF